MNHNKLIYVVVVTCFISGGTLLSVKDSYLPDNYNRQKPGYYDILCDAYHIMKSQERAQKAGEKKVKYVVPRAHKNKRNSGFVHLVHKRNK